MALKRDEIDSIYKWDLTSIYKNEKDLVFDMKLVKSKTKDFLKYKGKVVESAKTLLNCTNDYFNLIRLIEKVAVFINLKNSEDESLADSKNLLGKLQKLLDEVFEQIAFYNVELLEIDYSKIKEYIKEEAGLEIYSFIFENEFREKDHTLSLKEEELLASMGEVLSVPDDTFSMLDNVDMKFSNIKDENGKEVELNSSNYSIYIRSENRNVRKAAFESLYNAYNSFKNTYASLLKGNVSVNSFIAKTRKYNSPLEKSLYSDNINKKLYFNLIEKVHNNLDIMKEYIDIRKNILSLDEVHLYDVYAPLVKENSKTYTFEQAKDIVINALKPLGDTYIKDLKTLFGSNMIDVYHNENKTSGAYSSGMYDTLPYVLLNYEGKFDDISTLAHEMGHSMHSFYSNKNRAYHDSSYPIFLAEIASTVNEILLNRYMSDNAKSKEEKAFYLNNLLEHFRTTLIRQTMFAEFESIIHDKEKDGEILTDELLCSIYLDLNKKYFPGAYVDDLIALEWARIPHFYNSFYVYKYATGISVAASIASDILNKKEGALENYLEFLKSGGSNYPLEILKKTGIDIVDDDTIDKALDMFRQTLKEFKELME